MEQATRVKDGPETHIVVGTERFASIQCNSPDNNWCIFTAAAGREQILPQRRLVNEIRCVSTNVSDGLNDSSIMKNSGVF